MTDLSNMPKALMLLGPTASGKTDLALSLAKEFPIEIISVDSALVYKEMDIGTAKPTKEEMEICPHHLIDILPPTESYSAAAFAADAEDLIHKIRSRNRIPLLVGGTMLYAKALLDGIAEMPASTPEIKEVIRKKIEQEGLSKVYEELGKIDPKTASRLAPGDTQRISRAMEVYALTGRPLSSFFVSTKGTDIPIATIGLMPTDRKLLHEQIAKRFDMMLEAGFLDEVERLRQIPGMNANLPSMRCVGYRQAWEYLEGLRNYDDFRMAGIAATRQLAKRQMTWLRSMKNIELIVPDRNSNFQCLRTICEKINQVS